jgi:hypothetical protein
VRSPSPSLSPITRSQRRRTPSGGRYACLIRPACVAGELAAPSRRVGGNGFRLLLLALLVVLLLQSFDRLVRVWAVIPRVLRSCFHAIAVLILRFRMISVTIIQFEALLLLPSCLLFAGTGTQANPGRSNLAYLLTPEPDSSDSSTSSSQWCCLTMWCSPIIYLLLLGVDSRALIL